MSLTVTSRLDSRSQAWSVTGNPTVAQFSFLLLLLTLGACAADQFFAPVLFSSSPLWAVSACILLVRRRRDTGDSEGRRQTTTFSWARCGLFAAAHVGMVLVALATRGELTAAAGTASAGGWIVALLKVFVLAPTVVLLPWSAWRGLVRTYAAEAVAGLAVLLTFFPTRILSTIWPWYGQTLGKLVFTAARVFVHPLCYITSFTPTILGPHLDVTILQSCSGIAGIELFDFLFAFVAVLDWNRLRKGRMLAAYFAGVAVMLCGNALRLVSFVVLGNRGFAEIVSLYHGSAGWIFFSVLFLAYLWVIYGALLMMSPQPFLPPNWRQHGQETTRSSNPEEKWEIVQERLKSGNISETCRRYQIAPNLYYRWKDEAEQGACRGKRERSPHSTAGAHPRSEVAGD